MPTWAVDRLVCDRLVAGCNEDSGGPMDTVARSNGALIAPANCSWRTGLEGLEAGRSGCGPNPMAGGWQLQMWRLLH